MTSFKSFAPVTHRLVPLNLPFKCFDKQGQLKVGGLYPGGDDDDGVFCLWPISIYFGPKM